MLRKLRRNAFLAVMLGLLLLMVGCSSADPGSGVSSPPQAGSTAAPHGSGEHQESVDASGSLVVHFLDVGQGDAILLKLPNGRTMLVDAGTEEAGPRVVAYLKHQGVTRLDYLVGTHPHADHIGGMAEVVDTFEVGKVYLPGAVTTTRTYRHLLETLKAKHLRITAARAGLTLLDDGALQIRCLAPRGADYENLNNWSAVLRVQYGETAFLLTGDAQSESEREMLAAGEKLKADVLKVGHHGSRDATSTAFIREVGPRYAVISVGKGNDYGHPHAATLRRLAAAGIKIYRTDFNGTVTFRSDGKTLAVSSER